MNLTDREKEMLKTMIDRGEPLPPRYRLALFADAPEVELIWQGKTSEVTNVVLPFQSIEQIDEPRAEAAGRAIREDPAAYQLGMEMLLDPVSGRQAGGWTNKLIWGDNKLVLSSLKNGPLRREIEAAGGLKLIYIDPPFDVGADFSFSIDVGAGETLSKEPSIIEELAYRDTWGKGTDSYLAMIYERLRLMHELLAEDGTIYVHIGWNVSHYVKAALDEIIGSHRFVNQIIWRRQTAHSDIGQGSRHLGPIHDVILMYSKGESPAWNMQFQPYSDDYVEAFYKHVEPET
ncbi:MAG: DNA methyltransferase, partial [Thermomicrobiales bacterium]